MSANQPHKALIQSQAERLLATQRLTERIAIEVKSFTRVSDMKDHRSIGKLMSSAVRSS
ncbi:element excision factor XisH family protein [Iningainema tapete]|uniref:element excision factor XisH family protein n=1 Tax=Iningainema tapete TaxID=2806730 RepID=UPI003080A478